MSGFWERLADRQYRFYRRVLHPEAEDIAVIPGPGPNFYPLYGKKYCLLITFKLDREPVPTPVWFGMADGRIYFRTERRTAKVGRILDDPHVRVVPCNVRGKPIGPTVEARAELLPPHEWERAERVIQSNYGLGRRLYEGGVNRTGLDLVYVEVTPTEGVVM